MKIDGTFEKILNKWALHYNVSHWIFKDGILQVELH